MDNPIKTFEPNEKGRDFVIGDLHGALRCFNQLLTHLKFDPAVDRMFSVGDLVDRGDDSQGCLRLLKKDWFHAALSNHEQMMWEAFNGGYMGRFWLDNGGAWGSSSLFKSRDMDNFRNGNTEHKPHMGDEDIEFFELLEEVGKLPFLITINHKSGKKFHIIHAELPPGRVITDSDLSSPGTVFDLATQPSADGDVFLWGRYRFGPFYKADPNNIKKLQRIASNNGAGNQYNDKLSHIISGHTIMQRPMTLVGQTNLDTGAYYTVRKGGKYGYEKVPTWAGLTCVCLDDWKFYRATPEYCVESTPIVINKADLI